MLLHRRTARQTSAFTLIEVLIVVAVIVALAAFLLPRYLGGKGADGKVHRAPITMAKDTVCQSDLRQVRMQISILKQTDAEEGAGFPRSLAELKLPADVTHCAVGGEAYVYDSQTGEVHCPHPGHERF